MPAVEPEHAHHLRQAAGLILQAMRGGRRFLDQRGVLLGHFIHLRNRLVDLLDAGALFDAGSGDLAHDVGHAAHAGDHFVHRAAGIKDQLAAGRDLVDRIADQGLDFLGGGGAALGQVAHLGGHHRKAAALFAGARRFDRGIEREQVGLPRDLVDHADDVGDLARRALDLAHRLDRFGHHLAAAAGDLACAASGEIGLLGILGVVLHRRGDLLHRGGGLLQARRLLFCALREIGRAGGDLSGGVGDLVRRLLDVGDG